MKDFHNFISRFTLSNTIPKRAKIEPLGVSYKLIFPNGFKGFPKNIEVDSSLFVQLAHKYVRNSINEIPLVLYIGNGSLFGNRFTPYLSVSDDDLYFVLHHCRTVPKGIWLFHHLNHYWSITENGVKAYDLNTWSEYYKQSIRVDNSFTLMDKELNLSGINLDNKTCNYENLIAKLAKKSDLKFRYFDY